uniref:Putative secreted protein n=1 Tax=Amblyomma triste TaxID=251400 RepID=A0A023G848_AMBTT
MSILAISVITALLHVGGCYERRRYDVGARCDSGDDCYKHLCCVRMTEWEGNKCQIRNITAGNRCSEIHWPLGADNYDAYLGGCPCGGGLHCNMDGGRHGTCQLYP